MSEAPRIGLVGATGLVGGHVMELTVGREDFSLFAVARREAALPVGAHMELFVAQPAIWSEVFAAQQPSAVICALGTTWNKAGKDEGAFRAVDRELVLSVAKAALNAGVRNFVLISAVGADPHSKNFYLRVKGEAEEDLTKLRFHRLDILRPGLLRGWRGQDRRVMERAAIVFSPVTDLLLRGKFRHYRSIAAERVGRGALALAMRQTAGKFVHDNDSILRAARELPMPRNGMVR